MTEDVRDPPLHCTAYAENGGCGREDCPRCGRPALIPPLVCGFCGGPPEEHSDSDSGPMSVCPPHRFDGRNDG